MKRTLVLLPLLAACAAPQAVDVLPTLRGANYVPSWASTSVAAWTRFDAEVVDRELGYARRLGLNSVRVFLQFTAWEADPKAFLSSMHRFVAIADGHGIRPMFVLFDSCFGLEPALDRADSKIWVNNPGFSRIAAGGPALDAYVREVVGAFAQDPRVLMWDVMNEPMADFEHVTREERDAIWAFVRHHARRVKALDRLHPLTVGHAVVEYIPKTADLVDVLSVHSYAAHPEDFQADLDLALHHGRAFGKPVIVSEFGNPGAGQRYETALDVIERNRLGFYFWELMIAKVMFADQAGLVYPDGTVRDPRAVTRLAGTGHGFAPKAEGGVPLKTPPDESALREFLRSPAKWPAFLEGVETAPRTQPAIMATLMPLGALGRRLARPRPEAMEVFELALSIPHHFRLGREAQAIADFERLLAIVRREVGK